MRTAHLRSAARLLGRTTLRRLEGRARLSGEWDGTDGAVDGGVARGAAPISDDAVLLLLLDEQVDVFLGELLSEELLERVDRGARHARVE